MTSPPRRGPGRAGFTLVEVMVVAVLIGVLAAMAVPSYRRSVEQARADLAAANLRTLWAAQRLYHLEQRAYAGSFAALESLQILEAGMLASDAMYVYQISSADAGSFTATATRAGSSAFVGTLTIDQAGAVGGQVVGGGVAITPGFR